MKIIRFSGLIYQAAIDFLNRKFPDLNDYTFREQQERLFSEFITYGDALGKNLSALGWDAKEIVYDIESIQKRWAEENGVLYRESAWQQEIALAQIEIFRPDIVYFQDIHLFPASLYASLKSRFPFLKGVVVFRGYPKTDSALFEVMQSADIVFVGSPLLQEKCKKMGIAAELVYHHFDGEIWEKLSKENLKKEHPFTFAGSSGFSYGSNHQPRYAQLVNLLRTTPLKAWLEEGTGAAKTLRSRVRLAMKEGLRFIPKRWIELLQEWGQQNGAFHSVLSEAIKEKKIERNLLPTRPLSAQFPSRCHLPLFGLDLYRLLGSSQITFNKHAAAAEGSVDNIRMFQATGMGACLLTDTGKNLSDLFEIDREVVTYSSLEECVEKVNYLLDHETLCEEIGRRGQRRTLQNHTAKNRARQVHEAIIHKVKG